MQLKEEYYYLLVLVIVSVFGLFSLYDLGSSFGFGSSFVSDITGFVSHEIPYEAEVNNCKTGCESGLNYADEKSRLESELSPVNYELNSKILSKDSLVAKKAGPFVKDVLFLTKSCQAIKGNYESKYAYVKHVMPKGKKKLVKLTYNLCAMIGTGKVEQAVKSIKFLQPKKLNECEVKYKKEFLRGALVSGEGKLCTGYRTGFKVFDVGVEQSCKADEGYVSFGFLKGSDAKSTEDDLQLCVQNEKNIDELISSLNDEINVLSSRKSALESELAELERKRTSCFNVCDTDLVVSNVKFVGDNVDLTDRVSLQVGSFKLKLFAKNKGSFGFNIDPVKLYSVRFSKNDILLRSFASKAGAAVNFASGSEYDYFEDLTQIVKTHKSGRYCAEINIDPNNVVKELKEGADNSVVKCIDVKAPDLVVDVGTGFVYQKGVSSTLSSAVVGDLAYNLLSIKNIGEVSAKGSVKVRAKLMKNKAGFDPAVFISEEVFTTPDTQENPALLGPNGVKSFELARKAFDEPGKYCFDVVIDPDNTIEEDVGDANNLLENDVLEGDCIDVVPSVFVLHSVSKFYDGAVEFVYSKNFNQCAHLYNQNSRISGADQWFCGQGDNLVVRKTATELSTAGVVIDGRTGLRLEHETLGSSASVPLVTGSVQVKMQDLALDGAGFVYESDSAQVIQSAVVGDGISGFVVVKNVGGAPAVGATSVVVKITKDGSSFAEQTISVPDLNLAPDAQREFSLASRVLDSPGVYCLDIVVDPSDSVKEDNDDNDNVVNNVGCITVANPVFSLTGMSPVSPGSLSFVFSKNFNKCAHLFKQVGSDFVNVNDQWFCDSGANTFAKTAQQLQDANIVVNSGDVFKLKHETLGDVLNTDVFEVRLPDLVVDKDNTGFYKGNMRITSVARGERVSIKFSIKNIGAVSAQGSTKALVKVINKVPADHDFVAERLLEFNNLNLENGRNVHQFIEDKIFEESGNYCFNVIVDHENTVLEGIDKEGNNGEDDFNCIEVVPSDFDLISVIKFVDSRVEFVYSKNFGEPTQLYRVNAILNEDWFSASGSNVRVVKPFSDVGGLEIKGGDVLKLKHKVLGDSLSTRSVKATTQDLIVDKDGTGFVYQLSDTQMLSSVGIGDVVSGVLSVKSAGGAPVVGSSKVDVKIIKNKAGSSVVFYDKTGDNSLGLSDINLNPNGAIKLQLNDIPPFDESGVYCFDVTLDPLNSISEDDGEGNNRLVNDVNTGDCINVVAKEFSLSGISPVTLQVETSGGVQSLGGLRFVYSKNFNKCAYLYKETLSGFEKIDVDWFCNSGTHTVTKTLEELHTSGVNVNNGERFRLQHELIGDVVKTSIVTAGLADLTVASNTGFYDGNTRITSAVVGDPVNVKLYVRNVGSVSVPVSTNIMIKVKHNNPDGTPSADFVSEQTIDGINLAANSNNPFDLGDKYFAMPGRYCFEVIMDAEGGLYEGVNGEDNNVLSSDDTYCITVSDSVFSLSGISPATLQVETSGGVQSRGGLRFVYSKNFRGCVSLYKKKPDGSYDVVQSAENNNWFCDTMPSGDMIVTKSLEDFGGVEVNPRDVFKLQHRVLSDLNTEVVAQMPDLVVSSEHTGFYKFDPSIVQNYQKVQSSVQGNLINVIVYIKNIGNALAFYSTDFPKLGVKVTSSTGTVIPFVAIQDVNNPGMYLPKPYFDAINVPSFIDNKDLRGYIFASQKVFAQPERYCFEIVELDPENQIFEGSIGETNNRNENFNCVDVVPAVFVLHDVTKFYDGSVEFVYSKNFNVCAKLFKQSGSGFVPVSGADQWFCGQGDNLVVRKTAQELSSASVAIEGRTNLRLEHETLGASALVPLVTGSVQVRMQDLALDSAGFVYESDLVQAISSAVVGDGISGFVTIKNVGDAPAVGATSVVVKIKKDGSYIAEQSISIPDLNLVSDAVRQFSLASRVLDSSGVYCLDIAIDPSDSVKEDNDDNDNVVNNVGCMNVVSRPFSLSEIKNSVSELGSIEFVYSKHFKACAHLYKQTGSDFVKVGGADQWFCNDGDDMVVRKSLQQLSDAGVIINAGDRFRLEHETVRTVNTGSGTAASLSDLSVDVGNTGFWSSGVNLPSVAVGDSVKFKLYIKNLGAVPAKDSTKISVKVNRRNADNTISTVVEHFIDESNINLAGGTSKVYELGEKVLDVNDVGSRYCIDVGIDTNGVLYEGVDGEKNNIVSDCIDVVDAVFSLDSIVPSSISSGKLDFIYSKNFRECVNLQKQKTENNVVSFDPVDLAGNWFCDVGNDLRVTKSVSDLAQANLKVNSGDVFKLQHKSIELSTGSARADLPDLVVSNELTGFYSSYGGTGKITSSVQGNTINVNVFFKNNGVVDVGGRSSKMLVKVVGVTQAGTEERLIARVITDSDGKRNFVFEPININGINLPSGGSIGCSFSSGYGFLVESGGHFNTLYSPDMSSGCELSSSTVYMSSTFFSAPGTYCFSIELDPDNTIFEGSSGENNNRVENVNCITVEPMIFSLSSITKNSDGSVEFVYSKNFEGYVSLKKEGSSSTASFYVSFDQKGTNVKLTKTATELGSAVINLRDKFRLEYSIGAGTTPWTRTTDYVEVMPPCSADTDGNDAFKAVGHEYCDGNTLNEFYCEAGVTKKELIPCAVQCLSGSAYVGGHCDKVPNTLSLDFYPVGSTSGSYELDFSSGTVQRTEFPESDTTIWAFAGGATYLRKFSMPDSKHRIGNLIGAIPLPEGKTFEMMSAEDCNIAFRTVPILGDASLSNFNVVCVLTNEGKVAVIKRVSTTSTGQSFEWKYFDQVLPARCYHNNPSFPISDSDVIFSSSTTYGSNENFYLDFASVYAPSLLRGNTNFVKFKNICTRGGPWSGSKYSYSFECQHAGSKMRVYYRSVPDNEDCTQP